MKKLFSKLSIILFVALFLSACSNKPNVNEEEIIQTYIDAHVNTKKEPNMHYKVYTESNISLAGEFIKFITVYDIKIVRTLENVELFQVSFILTFDGETYEYCYYYDGERYYLDDGISIIEVDESEAGDSQDMLRLGNLLVFDTKQLQNLSLKTINDNSLIKFDLDRSILTTDIVNTFDLEVTTFMSPNTKYETIESSILVNKQSEIIQKTLYIKYTDTYAGEKVTVDFQYIIEILEAGDSVTLDFEK